VLTWLGVALLVLVALVLAWGWFEAGWLRRRVLEVELEDVPAGLDGLRIAHLSDFHLGGVGRGRHAVENAVSWVVERRPDLVCVTGDLVSRRSGVDRLRRLLDELRPCYVILGNHDLDDTRDPFSQRFDPAVLAELDGITILADAAVEVELRGLRVQIVGVEPTSYARRDARPHELVDVGAPLRLLLCHFPGIVRRVPSGAFHLVLAGHLHAGQITVPHLRGKLPLAHLRAREVEGLHRVGSTVLHVSPGLGTTFVPFRFFARPEVTELVVRSASMDGQPLTAER
jgi:predicted MPP superfamily phosphohydrolase